MVNRAAAGRALALIEQKAPMYPVRQMTKYLFWVRLPLRSWAIQSARFWVVRPPSAESTHVLMHDRHLAVAQI